VDDKPVGDMGKEEIESSGGSPRDESRDPNASRFVWREGDVQILRPGDPEYIDPADYDDDTKELEAEL